MVKTRQRSKRWKPQIAAYQVNTHTHINTAAVPKNTIQHKNEGYQIWRDIFKAHSWRSWGVNSMFADYIISLMIFTPPPVYSLHARQTCSDQPTNQKPFLMVCWLQAKRVPPVRLLTGLSHTHVGPWITTFCFNPWPHWFAVGIGIAQHLVVHSRLLHWIFV